jgi:integrase
MSVKPVSKNGRPHWRVRVVRKQLGIERTRFLDRRKYSKRQAEALERRMIARLEERRESGGEQEEPKTTSEPRTRSPAFEMFARRYIEVLDPSLNDYGNKVQILEKHFVPFFGTLTLEEIGVEQAELYKASRRKPRGSGASSRRSEQRVEQPKTDRRKGGALSRKTINNHITVLRHLLGVAHEWGELQRVPKIRLDKLSDEDPPALSASAVRAVLAVAHEWSLILLVAFRTGLRVGELRELRWKDVDVVNRRIRVQRQFRRNRATKREEVAPLKGKRPRTVPLAWDVAEALSVARGKPEGLVFPAKDGGHLASTNLYRAFRRVGAAVGLGDQLHPHLTRHTFATRAAERGVPIHVLQRWMGHADIRTTRRYLHAAPNEGAEFIDRLAPDRGLRVVEDGVDCGAPALGGTNGGTNQGMQQESGS